MSLSWNLFSALAAVAVLAITGGTAEAKRHSATPTGFLFETLDEGGKEYKYAVYVPRQYDPKENWPMILFLHGSGESGSDGAKPIIQGIGSAILWDADHWPFIVVIPQKPNVDSEWEEHEAAVMAMVAHTRETYNIDASRLYLTGLSQGGHGAWVLGARHADMWAAIVPIASYVDAYFDAKPGTPPGPAFNGKPADLAPALKDIPIWVFHGEVDSAVPLKEAQDMVAALKAAGGSPKFTTYPNTDHNSWDKAYREESLYAWLLAQKKPTPAPKATDSPAG